MKRIDMTPSVKSFIHERFLLQSDLACELYKDYKEACKEKVVDEPHHGSHGWGKGEGKHKFFHFFKHNYNHTRNQ